MKSIELKTDLLLGFFIAALLLANTLGIKIISLFGIRMPVGVFFIPIIFLITDIVAEVHGKKKAKSFVYIAMFVLLFTLAAMYIFVKVPPNPLWDGQEHYAFIFGSSVRIVIASFIAFSISQFHDVWTFHKLKEKTKGKYLWLRNNVSTTFSQLIDTTIFMFVAFYHVSPKFTVPFIISLIIPYWLFKIAFALIDTPFIYIGKWWLRKE